MYGANWIFASACGNVRYLVIESTSVTSLELMTQYYYSRALRVYLKPLTVDTSEKQKAFGDGKDSH